MKQNLKRNIEIYNKYITGKYSFSALAKEYGLSKQRMHMVVRDVGEKGLGEILGLEATKGQRDDYLEKAIKVREGGNNTISLDMFNSILAWDKGSDNHRGAVDVYGHIVLCYSLLSNTALDKAKLDHLQQAKGIFIEAEDYRNKHLATDIGKVAVQNVHLSKINLKIYRINQDTDLLSESEDLLQRALENFPGSLAHKSWPLNSLAEAYYYQGNLEKAVDTLLESEKCIFLGSKEEIEREGLDKARITLNVWLSGVHLAMREIAQNEGIDILPDYYKNAIKGQTEPTLKARKDQLA